MSDDDDEVGYRKPPRAHQFVKGRSGNPNGRPKRTKAKPQQQPVIAKVLKRKVQVTIDGRRQWISVAEALTLQMVEQATKGKIAALRYMMAAHDKIEAEAMAAGPETPDPRFPVEAILNILEPLECLYAAGVIYMRQNFTFAFERGKFDQLIAGSESCFETRSDLKFAVSSRAEDPEAVVAEEHESLFDLYCRLAEAYYASKPDH